jgi:hypothetical protein
MAEFQKSDIGWQVQQFFRQAGEWLELRLSGVRTPDAPDLPNWSFPSWWWEAGFWMVISIVVLWLLFQIYLWLRPLFDPNQSQLSKLLDRRLTQFEKERSISAWVKSAQEFQQQGNYREASRSLYMAMLQRLSETKLIPTDKSRTDREYSRLVQLLPQSESYQTLLETHELICFSNAPVSAEMFERVQRAYGNIERATLDMAKMA